MLTPEEVSLFQRYGWVGPFRALGAEDIGAIRQRIVAGVLGSSTNIASDRGQCRHLDSRAVYDLCALPAITERIARIYGRDLILWRSHLWCKQPGDEGLAWHQDLTNWPLNPKMSISAWLALDRTTAENGCVRVIPGSQRTVYPVKQQRGDPLRDTIADRFIDESKAIDIELEPGEFFLFSERLLHASGPNRSPERRMGLAIRVTVPSVTVDHSRLCGGKHRNIVLRGTDNLGLNELQKPPDEEYDGEQV
jgi:ectoine hydroxylase-related dioxygenase (phytanoyl-CoA dioxygenase family)